MESYIVIEGKRIELPKVLVDHIKDQLKEKYELLVSNSSDFDPDDLSETSLIAIGKGAVPTYLRGRCLILNDRCDWSIINNPYPDRGWSKLLVATEK